MAARLLNFAILLVLLGLLHRAVRRWVSPGAAWLLVTLFATTPMVQLVTGSLFVENLLAAFVLGMMIALWRFGESGRMPLSVPRGGPRRHCHGDQIRRHRLPGARARLRRGGSVAAQEEGGARWGLALGLLLLTAAPPYAIAWVKTGNPIFPFRNDRFHSRQLDPKADIRDIRFHEPLTWNTPYDLTFRSNRYYEGQHGSFGFQYLVIAPLALLTLLVSPRRQAVGAAVVAVTAILLVLNTEPNARYLYPALPLLFVPLAALLGWAAAHQRALARTLIAFCHRLRRDQRLFSARLQLVPQGFLRTVYTGPTRGLHGRGRAHPQRDRVVQSRPSASRPSCSLRTATSPGWTATSTKTTGTSTARWTRSGAPPACRASTPCWINGRCII